MRTLTLPHLLPSNNTPPFFLNSRAPALVKHQSSDIFKDRQIDRLTRQTPYGGPLVPPVHSRRERKGGDNPLKRTMSAPLNGELAGTANPKGGLANTADPPGASNNQQSNADLDMDTSPTSDGEELVDYNEEEAVSADKGGDMQVEVSDTQIGAEMAPGLDADTAAAVANGKALVMDWRQGQQAPVAQAQTSAGASEVKTPQSESAKSTILELLDEKFRFTGPDGHQTMLEAGMMGAARSISEVLLERNTTYDLGRSDPLTGNVAAFPNEEEKALRGLGKYADDPVWEKSLDVLSREPRNGSVEDPHKQTPLVLKTIVIAKRPLLASEESYDP